MTTEGTGGLHEVGLPEATIDRHRAIESLREELEAVDWYDQRAAATRDGELREILLHNRDEEKEHAAMLLEWLRQRDAGFAEQMRTWFRKEGQDGGASEAHAAPTGSDGRAEHPASAPTDARGLGIGDDRQLGSRGWLLLCPPERKEQVIQPQDCATARRMTKLRSRVSTSPNPRASYIDLAPLKCPASPSSGSREG